MKFTVTMLLLIYIIITINLIKKLLKKWKWEKIGKFVHIFIIYSIKIIFIFKEKNMIVYIQIMKK